MVIFEGARLHALGLVLSVMIDEVIARDSDNPRFQRARFGPIRMERPVHL